MKKKNPKRKFIFSATIRASRVNLLSISNPNDTWNTPRFTLFKNNPHAFDEVSVCIGTVHMCNMDIHRCNLSFTKRRKLARYSALVHALRFDILWKLSSGSAAYTQTDTIPFDLWANEHILSLCV